MKHILAILILFATNTVFAQKIYTRNDTITITQDSVTIKAGSYRGNIQWQKSLDNENWLNLEGKTTDSLKVKPDTEAMYRAKVAEGTCLPVYSDTLIIKPLDYKTKINERIDSLFPANIVSLIQAELKENESQPEYKEYLVEMNDATKSLIDTINKYSSPIEFELAILKFQSDFENPFLKSSNSLGCNILNAGLGYAKGVSVKASVGAGVSDIISLGLKAQQGGGAEIVYDFVNQTRQIYIYKMCSLSETFGAGMGGGFSGILGVSGYIKWLTNIPFYQQNSMSRFAGPSKSQKIGLSGKFELGLGINPSISIGTSKGVEGDCDNVYNLFECPVYFNNQTPKVNGVTSIITIVSGAVSAGASAELVAAFSNENGVSCSSGINESYIDYKNGGKNRMYAALKMASEIIITSPIKGLTIVGSSFDLIAASAAITYATIDVENCPLTSFATVTTNAITSITQTTAICGGNINSEGGSTVTDRGVCWNTAGHPTPDDNHTFNLSVTGSFTANLSGLTANTTYYVRAYATNSAGTAYGEQLSFTTATAIETDTVTDIDGNVYQTVKIGDQWWMVENLKTTKYNDGTSIPNVTDNTEWRALTTGAYCWYNNDASNKSPYGALYNGYAVNTGQLAPLGWHVPTDAEWTTLTDYLGGESVAGGMLKENGFIHWRSPNTNATNETGFTALPGSGRASVFYDVEYGVSGYWWCFTESSKTDPWDRWLNADVGSVQRDDRSKHHGLSVRCIKGDVTSSVVVPTVTTNSITAITQTTATTGGNITSDGGATVTARGVCWSTTENPTIANNKTTDGSGIGSFNSSLTGLTANTKYFVRAYATNNAGTGYGNQISFTTTTAAIETGTVTDIDGNVYQTVKIGDQWWMAENLKTTKYNDGASIPNVTDITEWANLTGPSYWWYNNDSSYKNPYGALYNWHTVNTGKLAPAGWHVPSYDDWLTLRSYLDIETAGGKLKETGTEHWNSPNTGATNESGFNALPGGSCGNGYFSEMVYTVIIGVHRSQALGHLP